MKKFLKKLLPTGILLGYHYTLARLAALVYGFPSKKMIVIGVTGTKGKTSTINFIWSCLTAGGYKTGIISTANIRIGDTELLNPYHMTMPGRFTIQRLLARMRKEGCRVCIVETPSQGILQYRHTGIAYDVAVFTNLWPEHIESHGGSFEHYKQTKLKLFKALSSHEKVIDGKRIEKVIIANADSEHANDFLSFTADKRVTFGLKNRADYMAESITEKDTGVNFMVQGALFRTAVPGSFNLYNALPAIIVARLFGVSDENIEKGLSGLTVIPGRMEKIDEGQPFAVFVDYAHEKESMRNVLQTANAMKKASASTIVLLGAEGGGRDKAKRPLMGEVAGALADYVIVSNVDPYEDDPKQILEDIAVAAEKAGKVRDKNLFIIEDRRQGIKKALTLAKMDDVVIFTGKGAEQSMIVGGKEIPWDDREVVREELKKVDTK